MQIFTNYKLHSLILGAGHRLVVVINRPAAIFMFNQDVTEPQLGSSFTRGSVVRGRRMRGGTIETPRRRRSSSTGAPRTRCVVNRGSLLSRSTIIDAGCITITWVSQKRRPRASEFSFAALRFRLSCC